MGKADELVEAVRVGDLSRVEAMLEEQPDLARARSARGESAVLAAIYNRKPEIAEFLIARGVELDLFEAAAAGVTSRVVAMLADEPSRVNGLSTDGWTPLHLAAFFGHRALAERLLELGASLSVASRNTSANTPLHAALAGRQVDLAALLVGHGADVNAWAGAGYRPLHLAAASGLVASVALLADRGADLQARNDAGRTPLAMALEYGHTDVAELLQQRGASEWRCG